MIRGRPSSLAGIKENKETLSLSKILELSVKNVKKSKGTHSYVKLRRTSNSLSFQKGKTIKQSKDKKDHRFTASKK
jgi:hypothetical protein